MEEWISRYTSENSEGRVIIPLSKKTLDACIDDKWALINAIKGSLFIRDLFDYKLPLKSDRYFYGREDIVAAIVDNVRKSQNSGLFGLRKTGKTSVLLKVQRALRETNLIETILFDCKNRPIRKSSCDDLAERIISELDRAFGRNFKKRIDGSRDIFDVLMEAVEAIPSKKKVCIIFDEIEYISPISPTEPHWAGDFIDFWQALWAIQSKCDKISFVVCGVNPTVCDRDRFESISVPGRTVQNPMFSIFNTYYLQGLDLESLRRMVRFFGARMGLKFDVEAIDYLYQQYGGHPLLSRLACSFHHHELEAENQPRPFQLTLAKISDADKRRDAELSSYCGHVVAEIKELYPDEYEMLKILAAGEISDFATLTGRDEDIRHIREYGLVSFDQGDLPRFRIPVVKRYLITAERDAIAFDEVERFNTIEKRQAWLKRRVKALVDDLLLLNESRRELGTFTFYRSNNSLKGHYVVETPLVDSEDSARSFLVHLHKYVVEPSDKCLGRGGVANSSEFRSELPILFHAFMRVKTYRNIHCHLEVNSYTEQDYRRFLIEDFNGALIEDVEDGWFKLQRRVMDYLHVALQAEISKT
ncbi:hypothetical protein [Mameliella sp. AT18]|uniref:hypothetical protein n=1 Tax=Mameliella sp. AT18 TaxID=3028385 RepID=UPI00237B409A|nr:hypothetical protein [Mameliella sp. AT18]